MEHRFFSSACHITGSMEWRIWKAMLSNGSFINCIASRVTRPYFGKKITTSRSSPLSPRSVTILYLRVAFSHHATKMAVKSFFCLKSAFEHSKLLSVIFCAFSYTCNCKIIRPADFSRFRLVVSESAPWTQRFKASCTSALACPTVRVSYAGCIELCNEETPNIGGRS